MAKVAESFPVHMSFESNAGGRSEMQSAASADVVVAAVAELFGEERRAHIHQSTVAARDRTSQGVHE